MEKYKFYILSIIEIVIIYFFFAATQGNFMIFKWLPTIAETFYLYSFGFILINRVLTHEFK